MKQHCQARQDIEMLSYLFSTRYKIDIKEYSAFYWECINFIIHHIDKLLDRIYRKYYTHSLEELDCYSRK